MKLRLAIGQFNSRLGDIPGNLAEACRLSIAAAREGARLILLPEGCLTGNALKDPTQQAALPVAQHPFRPLCEVARREGITICPGFATPQGRKFNIVQAVVRPSGPVLFQRKTFRAGSEPRFLAPWPDAARVPFEVAGVRVAIAICSEYGTPEVEPELARAQPALILHSSAGSMRPAEVWTDPPSAAARSFMAHCRQIVTRSAAEVRHRGIPKAAANPIGFDGAAWWPGNSFVIDARGRVVCWLKGENRPARMQASFGVAELEFD